MAYTVKYLNDKGEEVSEEAATYALVAEYDESGKLINETFGILEIEDGEQE